MRWVCWFIPCAARQLQAFAEHWRSPAVNAFRFQDAFDNHHPQYASDVGIAPSPKLAERVRQRLAHIHPDPSELKRVYQAEQTAITHADYLANLQPQSLPGSSTCPPSLACCGSACPPTPWSPTAPATLPVGCTASGAFTAWPKGTRPSWRPLAALSATACQGAGRGHRHRAYGVHHCR